MKDFFHARCRAFFMRQTKNALKLAYLDLNRRRKMEPSDSSAPSSSKFILQWGSALSQDYGFMFSGELEVLKVTSDTILDLKLWSNTCQETQFAL